MEPEGGRTRWLRWLVVLAGVLLVAGGGAYYWVETLDLSKYQARIVDQVRKVTGRELAAKTPLRVNMGWRPSAFAENVTLTNATWGTRPEMVRVKRITIDLDLFTLLLGDLKIGRIAIEGADLLIERNANGESNLEMAPPPDGSGPHARDHRSMRLRGGPILPWVNTVELVNSQITIADGEGRSPIVLVVERLNVSAANSNAALQGELVGRVSGGATFALRGNFGSFEGWLKGLPGKLEGRGTLGAGTLAIDGSVSSKGMALTLKADGPDLSAMSGIARIPLPAIGPFEATAKTSTTRTGWKIEIPALKIGTTDIPGEIVFRTDRFGRKIVSASFEAAKIDLDDLRRPVVPPAAPGRTELPAGPTVPATGDGGKPPVRGASERILPSDPMPIELLKQWNANLSVKVGEIVGAGVKVTSAGLTIGLSGGRMVVRPAATVASGSIGLEFIYDVSGKAPTANLTTTVNRMAVEELALLLGFPGAFKGGVGDLDLKLRSTGRTVRDIVINASGSIDLTLGPGAIGREHLQFILGDWRRLTGTGDRADIGCLALHADVTGGTAFVRRLVLDLPKAVVIGGGYIHSRSETLELILAPEAREVGLIAVAVPLRIKASATTVSADPDAAAAKPIHLVWGPKGAPSLVGSMGPPARAAGAPNPCATMLGKLDIALRPNLRSQLPTPPANTDRGRRTR